MNGQSFMQPSVSHRFMASFFFHSALTQIPVPGPLEIGFQRISGLERELQFEQYQEGGQNFRNQYFTKKVQHGSLLLERGVMPLTGFDVLFNLPFVTGKTIYASIVITVFDHGPWPLTNWLVVKAIPVRWKTSDLDANSNSILLNTLELRCQEIIPLGVKL